MGLAGTKVKRKWAKDPNNTAWSRNTDAFGQKILRQQGWQPGQYLGAQDAHQSEFFTAANASHLRVVLKNDNLGLGAPRSGGGDECTGLDAFQELLGRLNGKSEQSSEEARRKREHVRMNRYLHRKLGTMCFVYGGLLVGDQLQELADELERVKEVGQVKEKGSNKERKSEMDEEEGELVSDRKKPKSKKRNTSAHGDANEGNERQKEKKERRRRDQKAEEGSFETKINDAYAMGGINYKKSPEEMRKKCKDAGDEGIDGEAAYPRPKEKRKRNTKEDAASSSSGVPLPQSTGTAVSIPVMSGASAPVLKIFMIRT